MEMKTINYKLEIDISRNSSPRNLCVLSGAFKGFGCPKRHPDALLAKTMPPEDSLEFSCSSLKFLQGAQRCTFLHTSLGSF